MQQPFPPPVATGLAEHSRFLQRLHRRYADEMPLLAAGLPTRETMAAALAALAARGHDTGAALRILRQLVLERLMRLDCEQQAPLQDITRAMTWLAELALDRACVQVRAELDARHGAPQGPAASRSSCGSSAWASWVRAS